MQRAGEQIPCVAIIIDYQDFFAHVGPDRSAAPIQEQTLSRLGDRFRSLGQIRTWSAKSAELVRIPFQTVPRRSRGRHTPCIRLRCPRLLQSAESRDGTATRTS